VLVSAELEGLPGLRHGFFTRQGGVSTGIYASLNCGVGSNDDPLKVSANRAAAMTRLGLPAGALVTLFQVHGRDVVRVDAPIPLVSRPKADAMVTTRPGIALGILAADCSPVLFADIDATVIGACHAGWRGALAGVTDATVAAMEKLGARRGRIVAVIGPTIAQTSYEVGPEFPGRFNETDAANARFFLASDLASPTEAGFAKAGRPGHFRFDLPGYLAARLGRLGLAAIADLKRDTLSAPDEFFSFRRTALAREPDYGRQLSAIALVPNSG
jgi:YfiH family protein